MNEPSSKEAKDNPEKDNLIEYVNRVKNNNDDEAFNIICEKLKGYIKSITNKFFISGYNDNDLEQECLIALNSKAIEDYQESKGPFIKFAKLCIRRHIITELKASKKKRNKSLNDALSLNESYEDDENGPCTLLDTIPDKPEKEHFENKQSIERGRDLYKKLSSKLTALEYKVLIFYLKNYNYSEIVNIISKEDPDINKKVVDNALCRIKNKAKFIVESSDDKSIAFEDQNFFNNLKKSMKGNKKNVKDES